MRNKELIHSIAQSIIEKHYYDEEECNEEDSDFFDMFEPEDDSLSFWDTTTPPRGVIVKNILACLLMVFIASMTFIAALSQPVILGTTYLILAVIISVAFFAKRIKYYSRNLIMVSIIGMGLLASCTALIATAGLILFRMFER